MSIHSQADFSQKYSISDFSVASGDIEGVSFEGRFVKICKSLCSNLEPDEVKNILVTYKLIGQYGSEIPQTALFKIAPTQQGHIISSLFDQEPPVKNGAVCFDLMLNSIS